MKTSINILNYLIFVGLLFASCKTKIQTNNSTASTFIEPKKVTVIDTIFSTYGLPPLINQPKPIPKIYTSQQQYEMAFMDLKNMLEGKSEPNFERAVFISENPHHNSKFTYRAFQNSVTEQLQVIQNLIKANDKSDSMEFGAKVNEYGRFKLADIRYLPKEKKELYRKALSNWAIFKYLTDTVFVYVAKDSSLFGFYHAPYSYATADPFGMKNWSNSQVMNLLISEKNQGNCFALTALYKILSDRLNADARLCTAPQHIYIQHKDPKGQYYNVELATAGHPGDGIIQTLTYTPSEAIMSGIALRDYDTKQSIGLCLVNLAKSYEHKFKTKDNEFMLRCAEVALAHDSLNLNALLLKQQVLDARVTKYASKHRLNNITLLKKDTAIKATVSKLEKHTALLNSLGYRQMPTDMQEMILNQFQSEPNHWNHKTRNPKPFTSIKVQDPKDEEYWTLTAGMFQEVFEPKKNETYGHYTLNTTTGKIVTIDTNKLKGFIIDPVAFAYDFGARMYDARLGRWLSLDPLQAKYPNLSPYNFVANSPIMFVDPDGKKIKPTNPAAEKALEVLLKANPKVDYVKDKVTGVYSLKGYLVDYENLKGDAATLVKVLNSVEIVEVTVTTTSETNNDQTIGKSKEKKSTTLGKSESNTTNPELEDAETVLEIEGKMTKTAENVIYNGADYVPDKNKPTEIVDVNPTSSGSKWVFFDNKNKDIKYKGTDEQNTSGRVLINGTNQTDAQNSKTLLQSASEAIKVKKP